MTDDRHALMTCDREHEDVVGPLYYFKLYDRMPGPYKTQLHRRAIIDVAADGTLAGVELIDDMPPPPRPADPPSSLVELLGQRCSDYDPDCATCFAHKQQDEILRLRAENEKLREQKHDISVALKNIRAENAKLWAALKPIADIKAFTCIYEWTPVEALRDDEKVHVKLTGAQFKAMRAAAAIRETGGE